MTAFHTLQNKGSIALATISWDLFPQSAKIALPKNSAQGIQDALQAIVVDPCRTLVVVIRPGHVPLALPLIHHEDDLCSDLRAEEGGLVEADILPLGKVLWWFDELDAGRRLPMR